MQETPVSLKTTPSVSETPVSMQSIQTTISQGSTPSRGLTGFTPYAVSTKKPSTGSPGFMPYLLKATTPTSGGRKHVERGLFNSLKKAFL